jgi:hypothetical protein
MSIIAEALKGAKVGTHTHHASLTPRWPTHVSLLSPSQDIAYIHTHVQCVHRAVICVLQVHVSAAPHFPGKLQRAAQMTKILVGEIAAIVAMAPYGMLYRFAVLLMLLVGYCCPGLNHQ